MIPYNLINTKFNATLIKVTQIIFLDKNVYPEYLAIILAEIVPNKLINVEKQRINKGK